MLNIYTEGSSLTLSIYTGNEGNGGSLLQLRRLPTDLEHQSFRGRKCVKLLPILRISHFSHESSPYNPQEASGCLKKYEGSLFYKILLEGSPSSSEYGCPKSDVPGNLYYLQVHPLSRLLLFATISIPRQQERELSMRAALFASQGQLRTPRVRLAWQLIKWVVHCGFRCIDSAGSYSPKWVVCKGSSEGGIVLELVLRLGHCPRECVAHNG
ncbi:hypothetical protein AVEN_184565-1 [Araneus ventricosus]|uniref:Uncharacterized protein n=1 Tax=Araneus ventricosus TaxID=182803 RepID=A0A4Y2G4K0_ARAVE|nr:hypothetical protein AVEN_184565-1 [Araneus ventricosus]